MAREKPWIGSRHQKESSATLSVETLDSNRTMMVAPLNAEAGEDPELTRCRTMEDVFSTYKPSVEAEIKTSDGDTADVNLSFKAMKDFSVDAVVQQSKALRDQRAEMLVLQDFVKQIRDNANLRKALDDPEQRDRMIQGLKGALAALGTDEE